MDYISNPDPRQDPGVTALIAEASTLIQALDALAAQETFGLTDQPEGMRYLYAGVSTMLKMSLAAVSSGSLGECRKETPYSSLRPVGSSDGSLKWCCNHDTEHCFPGD